VLKFKRKFRRLKVKEEQKYWVQAKQSFESVETSKKKAILFL
jgi:hypothetical protein